jgi:hypothetical protein
MSEKSVRSATIDVHPISSVFDFPGSRVATNPALEVLLTMAASSNPVAVACIGEPVKAFSRTLCSDIACFHHETLRGSRQLDR